MFLNVCSGNDSLCERLNQLPDETTFLIHADNGPGLTCEGLKRSCVLGLSHSSSNAEKIGEFGLGKKAVHSQLAFNSGVHLSFEVSRSKLCNKNVFSVAVHDTKNDETLLPVLMKTVDSVEPLSEYTFKTRTGHINVLPVNDKNFLTKYLSYGWFHTYRYLLSEALTVEFKCRFKRKTFKNLLQHIRTKEKAIFNRIELQHHKQTYEVIAVQNKKGV